MENVIDQRDDHPRDNDAPKFFFPRCAKQRREPHVEHAPI